MIVFYNISCDAGQQAFFKITEISMGPEKSKCMDPNTDTMTYVVHG